jgi:hypothetical protein
MYVLDSSTAKDVGRMRDIDDSGLTWDSRQDLQGHPVTMLWDTHRQIQLPP